MSLPIDLQLVEWALNALEQREVRALVWGLVDSALSDGEVQETLEEVLADHPLELALPECTISVASDLQRLLETQALLFKIPVRAGSPDRWRTRMAEGVRLLARMRQLFPRNKGADGWMSAPTLVADYRLLWRSRRYPNRNIKATEALATFDEPGASPVLLESLKHWFGKGRPDWAFARFQIDAAARILAGLNSGVPRGTLVAAGTGSGKTLAFYLPALAWLASERLASPQSKGVRVLALYPRNELLKDQLGEVYDQARKFDDYLGRSGAPKISVGVLYSDTPTSLKKAMEVWKGPAGAKTCPFFRCPIGHCGGDLQLHAADVEAGIGRLRCRSCGSCVESDELQLDRSSMEKNPPDVLFTSVEMLNQRMSDSQGRHLFGLGPQAQRVPQLVLLDEVHLYTGAYGAQVAYLLRRWSAMTKRRSSFVGLSATIAEGKSFFAALTGMDAAAVEEISPRPEDMKSEGAEYLLALRGDPASQTALLSTSIQALMLMARLLDRRDQVSTERPFSGWRVFAFTEQMDATNRLFLDLRDAEGRDKWGDPATQRHPDGGLAVLREPMSSRRRYEAGQDWRVPAAIGHQLKNRLNVERTTAYDTGVASDSEIVVATAALEVGYDDPAVGVVLQHKAPRDMAQFLQRKGRAGRTRHMRPWTLMVLSDYGRDRVAYQAYDQYFDPELPPRELPLGNRYVRRMQAVYALLDFLGQRMQQGKPTGSIWRDLKEPQTFSALERWSAQAQQTLTALAREANFPIDPAGWTKIRNAALAAAPPKPEHERWQGLNWVTNMVRKRHLVALLSSILNEDASLEALSRHLAAALDLPEQEIRGLLWEHPRPLMLTVIPTAIRRLATDWRANNRPKADYIAGHPLPEFAPATLFSDLSLPELQLTEPAGSLSGGTTRYLPVQQGLSELAPGKVSRRLDAPLWLGIDSQALKALLDQEDEDVELEAEVNNWYQLEPQPAFSLVEDGCVVHRPAFRPVAAKLAVPPDGKGTGTPAVMDTSNARLIWSSQLFARQAPLEFAPPTHVGIAALVKSVHVHTHAAQNPATVRRYAVGSHANLRVRRNQLTVEQRITWRFVSEGQACGVGFEMEADALVFVLSLPSSPHETIDWKNLDRARAARSSRYTWEAQNGSALSAVVNNPFRRTWLALIFQTAVTLVALKENCGLREAIQAVVQGQHQGALSDVLGIVFQSPLPGNVPGEDEDPPTKDVDTADRLRQTLEEELQRSEVLQALQAIAQVLMEPFNASWDEWLLVVMKHTLGAAILEAVQQSCPQVDAEELAVDIDAGPSESEGVSVGSHLWLSEVNPGGNGLIEQVVEVLAQEPERFYRHIESALSASEFEVIDTQMRETIECLGGTAGDAELLTRCESVRNAVTSSDAASSLAALRRLLVERGQAVFHGYVVALTNRLLRPGTPRSLDALLAELFRRWEALELEHGIEIDARVVCALFSEDTRIDAAFSEGQFDLPAGERQAWRFSVLTGIVWARGHALRSVALPLQDRFSTVPPVTERLLLAHWLSVRELPIDAKTPNWSEALRTRLVKTNQATVAMPAAIGASCLHDVIQEVVTQPVQFDYLNVYARLVGVARREGRIELHFELPEAA